MYERANQQTSIRSYYAHRLELQQKLTDVALLTTGFLLAISALIDRDIPPRFFRLDTQAFMLLAGALGALNFAVALVLLYMRPGPRADNQKAARRHYTHMMREAKRARDMNLDVDVDDLERRYLADELFQDVPDRLFLIYKDRHLRKVYLSKLMSREGLSLKQAKKRYKLDQQGKAPVQ